MQGSGGKLEDKSGQLYLEQGVMGNFLEETVFELSLKKVSSYSQEGEGRKGHSTQRKSWGLQWRSHNRTWREDGERQGWRIRSGWIMQGHGCHITVFTLRHQGSREGFEGGRNESGFSFRKTTMVVGWTIPERSKTVSRVRPRYGA